ncbi:MAG: DHA2 family efflux MFS transporter permease subunit [Alphaproteobacteria bacterium]|nr:DHA2 family efflux MFS transporter permease subunit [Alphaproteobacteria bacterium]
MNTSAPVINSVFTSKNIGFFGMIIGMFMAILDIQIVASSLPVIGAGLSASQEELSWVQTSYIIAEVIVIPLTGFLVKLLSTRISFCIAAIGFTLMSIVCAISTSLEWMIIGRFLQGMFGGAMIPTVFGVIYVIFEPKDRPSVIIIIGLVVTTAPTLGPTLGGYITEILSWHFMFLLNVVPGIITTYLVYYYADFDKPNKKILENFDYIGIILLICFLGSLQYILEEGGRKYWFESNLISSLAIIALCSFIVLIYNELVVTNPILDLSALKNQNFAVCCILSGVLGVGLYGSVFLLPLFLGSCGLNTIQIGIIMIVTGAAQFISAPFAGNFSKQGVDKRLMMFFGLSMFGLGCYLNSFLTAQSRFHELMLPQFVRGFAIMFCFVPINDLALGTLSKEKVQYASGLYNLMRNLGGAFGLAIINHKLSQNKAIYSDILSSNLTSTGIIGQNHIENLTNYLHRGGSSDTKAAMLFTSQILQREAFIIAINNMFAYIGFIYIFALILVPLTKNTQHVETNSH